MSYKIGRYSRFDHVHVLTPFHVGMQFKQKMMNITSQPCHHLSKSKLPNRHTLDKFELTYELHP